MSKERPGIPTMHGFRPVTEGYQPGSQILQKGYVPMASGTPVSPPSGGSSAMKPAQASAATAAAKASE
jgi:hypothetical protein